MTPETEAVLSRVKESFPNALLSIISGSPGVLPSHAADIVRWAEVALRMCITSVTVETAGTVTVVDYRASEGK